MVGRFKDDDLGYGMDPDLPVTLHLHDVVAIDVMRLLLEVAASSGEACEWQVRRGYIELGTKARLSVPAGQCKVSTPGMKTPLSIDVAAEGVLVRCRVRGKVATCD